MRSVLGAVCLAFLARAGCPVRLRAGGTVTFANRHNTAQTDASSQTAEFDTGRLEQGERKAVKLDGPGRFMYFCAYHRFMEGTVEVVR